VVRDKDGISAALVLLDLASNLKTEGRTLRDALEVLYKRHGFYRSQQISVTMEGTEGAQAIAAAMKLFREQPPHMLADKEVIRMRDVLTRVDLNCQTCESDEVPLPPSNVLEFTLEDGSRILARPSGTEPKIKMYVEVVAGTRDEADQRLDEVLTATSEMLRLVL
jgi:phosphomannomutase